MLTPGCYAASGSKGLLCRSAAALPLKPHTPRSLQRRLHRAGALKQALHCSSTAYSRQPAASGTQLLRTRRFTHATHSSSGDNGSTTHPDTPQHETPTATPTATAAEEGLNADHTGSSDSSSSSSSMQQHREVDSEQWAGGWEAYDEEYYNEDDGSYVPDFTSEDRELEAEMREAVGGAGVVEVAMSMFAVGLQGSGALAVGYLLMHKNLLDSFRWSLSDVETGLLWALPATVFGTLLSALPLPTHRQFMNTAMAAATATAGNAATTAAATTTTTSSSDERAVRREQQARSLEAFFDASRMATNSAAASAIPVRVNIGGGDSSGSEREPLTQLSPATFSQALRYMQEYLAEPWSVKTNSLQSWGLRTLSGVLRRVSVEVFWRGLVVAGLGGWLFSSWETAGTSQDSPFFYARLFGLLTPQAALGVISALLVATRLPADIGRCQPAAQYTRLASMENRVVGQLTEDDYLIMVLPAEAAAVAAAVAAADGSSSRGFNATETKGVMVRQAVTEKVAFFGRMREKVAAGEAYQQQLRAFQASKLRNARQKRSSSSNGGDSSSSEVQDAQPPQPPQLTKNEMQEQLDKLLAAVADWKRTYSSGSGTSTSSSDSVAASKQQQQLGSFVLTPREQAAAELIAEFLELVKSSAAAKAAAAAATNSRFLGKSAGIPSSKLAAGLETLLTAINDNPQRRLLLLHVASDDSSSSGSGQRRNSSGRDSAADRYAAAAAAAGVDSSFDSDSEEDEDDSSEDESDSNVQAMMRAKTRTAIAAEAAARSSSSSSRGGSQEAAAAAADAAPSRPSSPSSAVPDPDHDSNSGWGWGSDSDSDDSDDDVTENPTITITPEVSMLLSKAFNSSDDHRASSRQQQVYSAQVEGYPLLVSGLSLQQYEKVCRAAYRVAASNIPTAQDRVALALLLSFNLLEQLATAGAFVASSGNLAASFTAAAAVQVVTTTLQQAVAQRERQRVRQAIGGGWGAQLKAAEEDE